MVTNLSAISYQCAKCENKIEEKYCLQTKDGIYHVHCLRCRHCDLELDGQANCYNRNGQFYCKIDYERLFHQSNLKSCLKCGLAIEIGQFVQRVNAGATNSIFHLECFKCSACDIQLQPGQRYTLNQTSFALLCERHFAKSSYSHTLIKPKQSKRIKDYLDRKLIRSKRNRTSFKLNQLAKMKAYFDTNKNPDSSQLNELATYTGLEPRVLRVWFQNGRAKCRRTFLQQRSIGPLIAEEAINLIDAKLSDDEHCEIEAKDTEKSDDLNDQYSYQISRRDQYSWLFQSLTSQISGFNLIS